MNDRKFEVRCNAGSEGQLQVKSHALSVAISQAIVRNAPSSVAEDMWQSLLIISEESENGSLTTKVIVCHPDWDHNLQIACIRSGPLESGQGAVEIDLKPISL